MQLKDIAAERGVLSGVCQYGQNSYLDVADIINSATFTVEYNQLIFSCLERIFTQSETTIIDVASIFSAGEELGLSNIMSRKEVLEHINSLFNFPISEKNVRKFAAKIRKLEIARLLRIQLQEAGNDLLELDGNESITEILGIAENAIFDFSTLLNTSDEEPKNISSNIDQYIQYLTDNEIDQVGISTGFPEYDKAIGGGFRPGTINIIGARSGVGKSIISTNMAYNIAKTHKLPVLIIDTEMTYEDHLNRLLAMASDNFIYDIETGKFSKNPISFKKIKTLSTQLSNGNIPYYHKSIAGMPFEEQMAIMRRWIVKEVGLNSDGTAKPCLIVYDYIKLMDSTNISNNIAEYQALGFIMSSLHNFTVKYKIPILALTQLNRDGVSKEGTEVASGSDRIIWLCSNFSILKEKSDEEISHDISEYGMAQGDMKLVPLKCRHGQSMQFGNYINCYMRGSKAQIIEGKTKFSLMNNKPKTDVNNG